VEQIVNHATGSTQSRGVEASHVPGENMANIVLALNLDGATDCKRPEMADLVMESTCYSPTVTLQLVRSLQWQEISLPGQEGNIHY
jgi:hypothetical protein